MQTEAKLRYDDMFIQAKGPPARVEFEIDDEDPDSPDDEMAQNSEEAQEEEFESE